MIKDEKYLKKCFKLARKGIGHVSPNPLVGSILVKGDRIISEGWHKKAGSLHAEAMAIKNASTDLKGSTLYCNLEPCCHRNKRTPPCAPLIINSGIKKVVFANIDPNPAVAGKSVKMMREAGIIVEYGIMEEEGKDFNRFFYKHIKEKLPWIHVKIAQSLDGKISTSIDEQTWLTGENSQKYVHQLRLEHDAVLVGIGTIITDNPQLNVRFGEGRDPLKIIIDPQLKVDPSAQIFKSGPDKVIIFCDQKFSNSEKTHILGKKVHIIGLQLNDNKRLPIQDILHYLGEKNIISLLIEGGQSIFSQFIESNIYDEITILQSPKILGKGVDSLIIANQKNLITKGVKRLGEDCCINFRKEIN